MVTAPPEDAVLVVEDIRQPITAIATTIAVRMVATSAGRLLLDER
jgi:hypothetical protein